MSEANQQADQQPQAEFMIQRLYLKDVSLESPNSPAVFQENSQPTVNLNIHTTTNKLNEALYEIVLAATVTATVDNRTVFLVEVKQAGIFTIKNIPEQNMPIVLNVTCPTVLFPYAREAISDLVVRGGFPHFYLAPINFEALYLSNLQKQQADAKDQATTH
jgi:preprotein translocase subunit SecB